MIKLRLWSLFFQLLHFPTFIKPSTSYQTNYLKSYGLLRRISLFCIDAWFWEDWRRIPTYLLGCWALSLFEDSYHCFSAMDLFRGFCWTNYFWDGLSPQFFYSFWRLSYVSHYHAMCFSLVLSYIVHVGCFWILVGGMYVCYKRLDIYDIVLGNFDSHLNNKLHALFTFCFYLFLFFFRWNIRKTTILTFEFP